MNSFRILGKLGEGTYSSVLKVRRLTDGQEYALKIVKIAEMKEKEKENAMNELRILASIEDNNIIGYKDTFFDEQSNCLCIVMEYAQQGDLAKKIDQHNKNKISFSEKDIWKMIQQISNALKILHDLKILHRDIKSANIFQMSDGNYKLGDMNVSKVTKSMMASTQTGTPFYASPEVWRDELYDSKSDIWSFGCVIYEMASLKPPFFAKDMKNLFKEVQKGVFEKIPPHYSDDLQQVISMCMAIQAKNRPSAEQLLNSEILRRNITHNTRFTTSISQLLDTIRIPQNLRSLKDVLPSSRYKTTVYQSLDIKKNKYILPSIPQSLNFINQTENSTYSLEKNIFRNESKKQHNKQIQNDQSLSSNRHSQHQLSLPNVVIQDRALNQKVSAVQRKEKLCSHSCSKPLQQLDGTESTKSNINIRKFKIKEQLEPINEGYQLDQRRLSKKLHTIDNPQRNLSENYLYG